MNIKNTVKQILPHFFCEVAAARYRRKTALSFYSAFIKPGDLVFDVGANVGDRTELFSALGARVIAFEPQSKCFKHLVKRFANQGNVTVRHCGLSDHPGEATIRIATKNTMSTFSSDFISSSEQQQRFAGVEWLGSEIVSLSTLEAEMACHGTPAFIKIDVEGFEPNVIKGLTKPIAALSFEWTPERFDELSQCLDQCVSLGINEFNLSLGESFRFNYANWVDSSRIKTLAHELEQNSALFGDVYARSPLQR